jgi:hypothetical protein
MQRQAIPVHNSTYASISLLLIMPLRPQDGLYVDGVRPASNQRWWQHLPRDCQIPWRIRRYTSLRLSPAHDNASYRRCIGTDPGITLSIYYPPVTSYTVPGPSVFSCGGSTGTTPTQAPAPSSTSSKAAAPAPTSSASSSSSAGSAAHYAQCGGTGYAFPYFSLLKRALTFDAWFILHVDTPGLRPAPRRTPASHRVYT